MNKLTIRPYNVIDNTSLQTVSVNQPLTDGDPIEIEGELYFVCEQDINQEADIQMIGVIPLVVRNPSKVSNIKKYIECLSIAHRKVLFKNKKGACDLENCDEMIIS